MIRILLVKVNFLHSNFDSQKRKFYSRQRIQFILLESPEVSLNQNLVKWLDRPES
jgi:hypothetical protein